MKKMVFTAALAGLLGVFRVELHERARQPGAGARRHDGGLGVDALDDVVGALGELGHLRRAAGGEGWEVRLIPRLIRVDAALVPGGHLRDPVIPARQLAGHARAAGEHAGQPAGCRVVR